MSFYISFISNINKRKAENVFCFNDAFLCSISNKKETPVLSFEKDENVASVVLRYLLSNNLSDAEVLLPNLGFDELDRIFKVFSDYLYENDGSIGLLTTNVNYREDYDSLINKYGITYSVPKIRECGHPKASEPRTLKPRARKEMSDDLHLSLAKVDGPIKRDPFKIDKSDLEMDEPFNTKFLKLLNESGKDSVEVYKKGGITRQVFSKVLSNKDFIPKKDTVICLIVGMELSIPDAVSLLSSAGYSLSKSIVSDVVVMKYLYRGIYDIDAINDELGERQCPLLGWKPRDE